MPYIGNPITSGENNSFKVLDDITSYTLTFNGSSASIVSVANNTITYNSHRFITGQRVTYNTTGTTITGLTAATVYFIIKEDQNTIKLATTYANAINNTAIDLTGLGTGTTHTINVAFDGVNTKFKATYDNGTKAQITRAAQLTLSVNGVIQQPQDTTSPTNGFGIDLDSVIIFSVAPLVTDIFWGNLVANNFPTFDISDNTVDSFTGTGSLTTFTLSKEPANSQNLLVTIDGVVQYPSDNTNVRAYSVVSNVLTFEGAPGNGTDIQVRHIGFAGATSSNVTGFYGRTGNVGLTTADNVNVGNLVVSGITTVSAGTTALPSISPSGDSNTGIFFPAADTIAVSAGGTERVRVNSSGDVSIATGNLIIGTSGKGIDFSADGNAAGMTSELLDDYEEGTWTTSITWDTPGTFTATLVDNTFSRYTKIGRTVHVIAYIGITAFNKGTASGAWYFAGLPFNINSAGGGIRPTGTLVTYQAPFTSTPMIYGVENSALVRPITLADNATFVALSDPDANSTYFFSLTYDVA